MSKPRPRPVNFAFRRKALARQLLHKPLAAIVSIAEDNATDLGSCCGSMQADAKKLRAYYEAAYSAVRRSSADCFIAISPRVRRQWCCTSAGVFRSGA